MTSSLMCHAGLHADRQGQSVWIAHQGERVAATVLSSGFDVHGAHVGWVGIPGLALRWSRNLCLLEHADLDDVVEGDPVTFDLHCGVLATYKGGA